MFGDYASFIIPAYAISFFVIIAMIVALRIQFSARKKEMAALEKSGVKRRAK